MLIKSLLKKIYHFVFRYKFLKQKIETVEKEKQDLLFQFEYLKRHSEITKLKPATGLLRNYQIKELNFAKEIIQLLNSMDIFPFIDSGCLIGAVRHKGFVPWDDDIDLGLIRKDFDKIEKIAKEKYSWFEYDNTKKGTNLSIFLDNILNNNPNKLSFYKTPYCIHVYKGTAINDSVNVEFFPYDYVKDGVTEEEYNNYLNYVKKEVNLQKPWNEIYNFYNKELDKGLYLTRKETSRIIAGFGNWDQTQYNFNGFLNYEDIFPLKTMKFENTEIPVPNNPIKKIENCYTKNWITYPKDLGISHDLESLQQYYIEHNIPYKDDDFIF